VRRILGRAALACLLSSSIALATAVPRVAQPTQTAAAPSPTFDQRLARLCEDLDQRREDLHISGLSLAIVKDDQVVLARGFGLRDREKQLPAEADTLYGIGSTTKAFTSMLCAMLVDEGKLSFDDRPAKHLPWFTFKDYQANTKATLRDLMGHKTGLTRTDVAWINTDASRDELLRLIAVTEPSADFRRTWQYNNCMFLCAGECAATVAGASWDELVARRIFAPLHMTRSVTAGAAALADPKLSQRYDWDDAKGAFQSVEWMRLDNMAPAGSICSSVVDMAQWVRFLLNRGEFEGKRLVADARFDDLWKDGTSLPWREGTSETTNGPGYGLGWFLHDGDGSEWTDPHGAKHRVVEHGGNVGGYAAEVGLLPDQKLGLVMLTNTSQTQLQQTILPLVWNTLLGPWKERAPVVEGKALPVETTRRWLGSLVDTRDPLHLGRALATSGARLSLVFAPAPGRASGETFTLLWPDANGHWVMREDPDSFVTIDVDEHGDLRSLDVCIPGRDPRKLVPSPPPRDGSREAEVTADDLLTSRVESAGLAAVASWKTLRLTGTLALPQCGTRGSFVVTARGTDAVRVDYDAGKFGRAQFVRSGSQMSASSTVVHQPRMSAEAAAVQLFSNPLVENGDWRDHAEEVELSKVVFQGTNVGIPLGEACYAVKVKPFGGPPIVYDVSVATQRVVAVEGPTAFFGAGAGLFPPIALLADVRDVNGAKIAFHREFPVKEAGRAVLQFDRAEVDVDVPPDFFDLPPDPKDVKPARSGS
jgi:CubicO group peptidase (beta-lactamase class C family)